MEHLNMYESLLMSLDRKAVALAVINKEKPVKEAYWCCKYKLLQSSIMDVLSRHKDDAQLVESLRQEIGKSMQFFPNDDDVFLEDEYRKTPLYWLGVKDTTEWFRQHMNDEEKAKFITPFVNEKKCTY